jgi:NADPH:quinone reductase
MKKMNKVILLNKSPVGKPALSDFKFTGEAMPALHAGEVLLKTIYVSVDPYLRGRMNDSKSYIPSFEIDKPIQSGLIAEVTDPYNSTFKKGDFVSGSSLMPKPLWKVLIIFHKHLLTCLKGKIQVK